MCVCAQLPWGMGQGGVRRRRRRHRSMPSAGVRRKPAAAVVRRELKQEQEPKQDPQKGKTDRHRNPKRVRPSGKYARGKRKGTWKQLEEHYREVVEKRKAQVVHLQSEVESWKYAAWYWKDKWRRVAGTEALSDSEPEQPHAGSDAIEDPQSD